MNKNKLLLVGAAVVYKVEGNKTLWFVVRSSEDSGWEIPKSAVRRGESSVRAVIRAMGEQGGMRAKVLEEVGRTGGSVSVNGKITSQKTIYYLMVQRGDSEVLGYVDSDWLDSSKAIKKLEAKKDQSMLLKAKDLAKQIQRDNKRNNIEEEDEEEFVEGQE